MGLLERYKKSGGFVQLLSLLETCGPVKREKFLTMIKEENTAWETALRQRILTLDKILSWPTDVVSEIVSRAQILTLTGVYLSVDASKQEIILNSCLFGQQKKIKDMIEEKKFTQGEISTSIEKFLIDVRGLINQNILKMEKIDSSMEIVSEIEDKLNAYYVLSPVKGSPSSSEENASKEKASASPAATPSGGTMDPRNANFKIENLESTVASEEINQLKKKLHQVTAENMELKHEVTLLREKLEKIRRIA